MAFRLDRAGRRRRSSRAQAKYTARRERNPARCFRKKFIFITLLPKMVLFFEFFMHIVSRLNYLTFKGLRR